MILLRGRDRGSCVLKIPIYTSKRRFLRCASLRWRPLATDYEQVLRNNPALRNVFSLLGIGHNIRLISPSTAVP